jgi:hypothetical protein
MAAFITDELILSSSRKSAILVAFPRNELYGHPSADFRRT